MESLPRLERRLRRTLERIWGLLRRRFLGFWRLRRRRSLLMHRAGANEEAVQGTYSVLTEYMKVAPNQINHIMKQESCGSDEALIPCQLGRFFFFFLFELNTIIYRYKTKEF